MPQGITYTIDYKAERDMALEQVQELKETVALLQRALNDKDKQIADLKFVLDGVDLPLSALED